MRGAEDGGPGVHGIVWAKGDSVLVCTKCSGGRVYGSIVSTFRNVTLYLHQVGQSQPSIISVAMCRPAAMAWKWGPSDALPTRGQYRGLRGHVYELSRTTTGATIQCTINYQ